MGFRFVSLRDPLGRQLHHAKVTWKETGRCNMFNSIQSPEIGQILDVGLAGASLFIIVIYHVWYYSWRFTNLIEARGYHRVDLTGQHAREIFVRAVVFGSSGDCSSGNADTNIALQATRNPITAESILATGTTVGATTLVGILLDTEKMERVRHLGRADPLTGASTFFHPEAKLSAAVAMLFLSFFALAQSMRLFIHFGFFVRAASYCHCRQDVYSEETAETMFHDACQTCLRAQTYFSLGLRFLYCFLPLIFWLLGGSYLLFGTIMVVVALYNLDQI